MYKIISIAFASFMIAFALSTSGIAQMANPSTPPMGWNSYDAFGFSVTEDEVKANADYMATNLKQFGWEYIVVDFLWYGKGFTNDNWQTAYDSIFVDGYGRMRPRPDNFPSSVADSSFKSLADYIHSKGLKFGIHLMRGIPRVAVENKLPVYGTAYTADEIGMNSNLTSWFQSMYSVDMSNPGGQAYYNSLIKLYASWGVDFIKVDGIAAGPYVESEIGGYYNAVNACGREMVISLSPGPAPLANANYLAQHANMWRIKGDLWDRWSDITDIMNLGVNWNPYRTEGAWPDADMLPLGNISIRSEATYLPNQTERFTRLTHDEQYTLMTFWTIFRSPMMFGGNLPDNDQFTKDLITNSDAIGILKNSTNNKQVSYLNGIRIWTADDANSGDKYLAIINQNGSKKTVNFKFSQLGTDTMFDVKNIWSQTGMGIIQNQLSVSLNAHGAGLYKLKNSDVPVDIKEVAGIRMFPNPCRNTLNIESDNLPGNVTISITSVSGIKVTSLLFTNKNTPFKESIDVSTLLPGEYILNILSSNHCTSHRILKQ